MFSFSPVKDFEAPGRNLQEAGNTSPKERESELNWRHQNGRELVGPDCIRSLVDRTCHCACAALASRRTKSRCLLPPGFFVSLDDSF